MCHWHPSLTSLPLLQQHSAVRQHVNETRRPRGSTGVLLPTGEGQSGEHEDAGRAGFEICSPFHHPHQRCKSAPHRKRTSAPARHFDPSSAKLSALMATQHKSASHHGGVSAARLPWAVMTSRQRTISASERRRLTAGFFRPAFVPRIPDDADALWKHHPGEEKDDPSYPLRTKPARKR